MKDMINNFSLADVKRHIETDDGLNDNVLIHDFVIEQEGCSTPQIPSRAETVGIVTCREGEIALTINAQEFTLQPGMGAMILPNCIYNIKEYHGAAKGTLFAVSTTLMKSLHIDIQQMIPIGMQMFRNPCFQLSEQSMLLYERYLEIIRTVSQRNENHSVEMFQGLLSSLLAFIRETMEQKVGENEVAKSERAGNRNSRLFEEFMSLLTENFRAEHQIGFYADKLCLTPKYLSLLIKQTSGRSVAD